MMKSMPGQVLEGPDVAALAADDAALHVVGRQRHDRDGGLGDVVGRGALDRQREDVAGPAVGFVLGLFFDGADELGHVVAGFVFGLLEQHLLGLRAGQAGDAFEHRRLLGVGVFELLGKRGGLRFALEDLLVAALELGRARRSSCSSRWATRSSEVFSSTRRSRKSASTSAAYLLELFFGFEAGLFDGGLGLALGVAQDALRLSLRTLEPRIDEVPSDEIPRRCAGRERDDDEHCDHAVPLCR